MYIFFDRPMIKERAKQHLSGHYWLSLGVALLTSAGGVSIGSRFNLNLNTNNSDISNWRQLPGLNLYHGNYRALAFGIVIACIAIVLVALAFQLALYYFVNGPLQVGGKNIIWD